MTVKIDIRNIVRQDFRSIFASRWLFCNFWQYPFFDLPLVHDILRPPGVVRRGLHALLSWTEGMNKDIKSVSGGS